MRRTLALAALGLAVLAAWASRSGGPEASAVAPQQVIGAYRLALKGDGWLRGTTAPYRAEKISGGATLVFSRNQPDDGRVHVEIRLDPVLSGGLVDLATPSPAFLGDGYVVGDSMTVIDSGGSTYVNALTLAFTKKGAKISGHWLASRVPSDALASPASAVGIEFTGRRVTTRTLFGR